MNNRKEYRVWWTTDGTMRHFYVDHVWEAKIVYETLMQREQDDETIGYNAGGLEMFDKLSADWIEFYDDHGNDITEFYEEKS